MQVSTRVRMTATVSAAVALALSGCSGDDEEPPAAAASSSAATTAAPSGAATPTTTTPASPGPPATATPGPSVAVSELPPVSIGTPADLQEDIRITVPGVKDTTVKASGPGEVAGPAAVVSVQVRNNTDKPFNLSALAVVASYGDGTPASPTNSGGAKSLTGSLPGGQTADGTYVFMVPAAQAGSLRVEVSSSTSPDIAIFQR